MGDSTVQACLQKSCKPKEIFATLNALSKSCNEPVRDKSSSYRTTLIVFFAFAALSVIGRYITHFTVGRTNFLDNANMGVAFVSLASNTPSSLLNAHLASKHAAFRLLHANGQPRTRSRHVDHRGA